MIFNYLLLTLCCVLSWTDGVRSENEFEVKRGVFPFMAILYYPDDTVVDATGSRFQHAAVLIRPEWLLSAAIDHSVLDNIHLGFPRKTLLARMGALTLDPNFTFNEDEDEQQREVIQIVKPSIHDKETWWTTDITLLKTLLPFMLSAAIAPTAINPKRIYTDNKCTILVYTKKYGSATEVRFLAQLSVELLPATTEHCGARFSNSTMTCAIHDPNPIYDPEFCPGNSGGPLLCEGEVAALQTYIENDCKQPHLYQLLAPWDTFINCAIEQKCNVEDACNVCTVTNKDDLSAESFPNDTQTNTVKEETAYSWSHKNQNNSVFENETLSERTKYHISKENESTESNQTKYLASYESQAFSSEQHLSLTTEKEEYSSSKPSEIYKTQEAQTSSIPLESDIAQENRTFLSMSSEIDTTKGNQYFSLKLSETPLPVKIQSSSSALLMLSKSSATMSPISYLTTKSLVGRRRMGLTTKSLINRRQMYSDGIPVVHTQPIIVNDLNFKDSQKRIGYAKEKQTSLIDESDFDLTEPPFDQFRYSLYDGTTSSRVDSRKLITSLILLLVILI